MACVAQRLSDWALNVVWRASTKPADPIERAELLRRLLRRYPRWSSGHMILAQESLERDDIAQAYAASRCYQALVHSDARKRAESNLLIGRCYLRRGDWQSALVALRNAREDAPHSAAVLEELAAAYMLGGHYSEARSALEQIPVAKLSAQAKAALAFARTKT